MEGCLVLTQDRSARYLAFDFRCAHLWSPPPSPLLTPKRIMPWSCSSDASVSVWMFIKISPSLSGFIPARQHLPCVTAVLFFRFFLHSSSLSACFSHHYPLFGGANAAFLFFIFLALPDEGKRVDHALSFMIRKSDLFLSALHWEAESRPCHSCKRWVDSFHPSGSLNWPKKKKKIGEMRQFVRGL